MWKFRNPFKKNYSSSYYGRGGNRPLFTAPTSVPAQEPAVPKERPKPVVAHTPIQTDWEQRRFELMKMLVAQDRRSVVLGKLRATDKQIAAKARSLADAAIMELQTHPYKSSSDEEGEKSDV